MFKIPLSEMNMTQYTEHGWRFGRLSSFKAFYITIEDTNVIDDTIDDTNDNLSCILSLPRYYYLRYCILSLPRYYYLRYSIFPKVYTVCIILIFLEKRL